MTPAFEDLVPPEALRGMVPWVRDPVRMQRAFNLLRRVVASEDQEIVGGDGGGWWVDDAPAAGRDVTHLLRMCVLREQSTGVLRYYTVNSVGMAWLARAKA